MGVGVALLRRLRGGLGSVGGDAEGIERQLSCHGHVDTEYLMRI